MVALNVAVFYGPVPSGDFRHGLFLGYDADPEGEFSAVIGDQEWAWLGAKSRTETFGVICAIVALIGEDDPKTGVDTAYAILAVVENELRANPSLGQAPPFVAEVISPHLHLDPSPGGLMARLTFVVNTVTRV